MNLNLNLIILQQLLQYIIQYNWPEWCLKAVSQYSYTQCNEIPRLIPQHWVYFFNTTMKLMWGHPRWGKLILCEQKIPIIDSDQIFT